MPVRPDEVMMERCPFIVRDSWLEPDGYESRAVLGRLSIGARVQVAIYQERPKVLTNRAGLAFDMISRAMGMRVRNLRGWIAIETGRCDRVEAGGRVMLIPHGTGPRDMKAVEFEAWWEDACEFIAREILPTLSPEDREDIARLIRPPTGESRPASAPS